MSGRTDGGGIASGEGAGWGLRWGGMGRWGVQWGGGVQKFFQGLRGCGGLKGIMSTHIRPLFLGAHSGDFWDLLC